MKLKKRFGIFILMLTMLIVGLGASRALALSDEDKKIVQTSLENLNSGKDSLEKSRETIQRIMKDEDKAAVVEFLVDNAGRNFKITNHFWQLAQDLGVASEFQGFLKQSLVQKADIVGETARLAMVQRVSNNITPVVTDSRTSDLVQAIKADDAAEFSDLLGRGVDFSVSIPLVAMPDLPCRDQRQSITPLALAAMLGSLKCFNYLTTFEQQPITFDTFTAACIGGGRNIEIIHKCLDSLQSQLTPRVLHKCIQIAIAFNYDSDFKLARWLSNQLEDSGASWQQIAALWARNDRAWEFFIEHYENFGLTEENKNFLVELIVTLKTQGLDLQDDPQVIAKMIEHEEQVKAVLPAGEDTSAFYQAVLETTRLGAVAIDETNHSSGEMLFPENNFAVVHHGTISIQRDAFSKRSNLQFVSLQKELTSIGRSAFDGCNSLVTVNFPAGLTSIGRSAFNYCSSLTIVNLPEGLTSIGLGAFRFCRSLITVSFPRGLTNIEDSTFSGCSSLTIITLPERITSIEDYAFSSCISLTTVNLPTGLTNIGGYAFLGCNSLSAVIFPEKLTSIGSGAFRFCKSLTTVNFPKRLRSIGIISFHGCDSLTTVNLPEGFDKNAIGENAFAGCSKLRFPL